MSRKDIRSISLDQLSEFFLEHGEKKFRAKQVMEWLWKFSASSFEEMTNLSKATRELLGQQFEFRSMELVEEQVAKDGTIKMAFKLYDGFIVEGVLIPTEKRMTACISSQVGCSLTCSFCATGKLKRMRNLDASEIYDQVVAIKNVAENRYNAPLTNIVYMGMGEPLLNYQNTLNSIDHITGKNGLHMASKRITVSTAGIAKMIKQLGDDEVKFNLALSLHAANDVKRSKMMPINDSNSLDALAESLNYFYQKTKNTITFEYIIFNEVNDSIDDAKELLKFCRRVPSKVNIIEYNPIDESEFSKADQEKTDAFAAYLEDHGVVAKVRRSRGKDIDAACGQLANKNKAALKTEPDL
ncbi:MAG: 23S rRNA (adenine(2503)-C(2))-methyltransferase RlmN [Flavobacteriales bacterium]|nr:23S rRNA (adenine(2503)-C(2))-methyltransferase RlmN [Flavobacteriales bacterium]